MKERTRTVSAISLIAAASLALAVFFAVLCAPFETELAFAAEELSVEFDQDSYTAEFSAFAPVVTISATVTGDYTFEYEWKYRLASETDSDLRPVSALVNYTTLCAFGQNLTASTYVVRLTVYAQSRTLSDFCEATVSISQKMLAPPTTFDIVYGQSVSDALMSDAYGTWTWAGEVDETEVKGVGSYVLKANYTPNDPVNYATLLNRDVTLNVKKRQLRVILNNLESIAEQPLKPFEYVISTSDLCNGDLAEDIAVTFDTNAKNEKGVYYIRGVALSNSNYEPLFVNEDNIYATVSTDATYTVYAKWVEFVSSVFRFKKVRMYTGVGLPSGANVELRVHEGTFGAQYADKETLGEYELLYYSDETRVYASVMNVELTLPNDWKDKTVVVLHTVDNGTLVETLVPVDGVITFSTDRRGIFKIVGEKKVTPPSEDDKPSTVIGDYSWLIGTFAVLAAYALVGAAIATYERKKRLNK